MNSAGAAALADSLGCQLTGPARVAAGQPVVLQLVVTNSGPHAVAMLTWGTPFEGRWFAPYVGVQRDGVDLPYGGASVKRGDPAADDYLPIGPAQSRTASFDIAQVFDVRRPGRYRVQPRLTLHDLWVGASPGGARPRGQHQAAALDCNALEVVVTPR